MSKLNIYACSGLPAGTIGSTAQNVARDIEDAGWKRNEVLRKYLGASNEGGCAEYFLYIFIPEQDLALWNATIYRKRKQQLKTFDYVKELFVGHGYGSEAQMLDIIRNGIESTFGKSVDRLLLEIRTGERDAIGDPLSIAIAIITAVLPLIIAVINGIIEYAKSVKVAKYTAPTYKEIEDSAPAATDITGGAKKKGLLFGALAGIALLVIGSFKE